MENGYKKYCSYINIQNLIKLNPKTDKIDLYEIKYLVKYVINGGFDSDFLSDLIECSDIPYEELCCYFDNVMSEFYLINDIIRNVLVYYKCLPFRFYEGETSQSSLIYIDNSYTSEDFDNNLINQLDTNFN